MILQFSHSKASITFQTESALICFTMICIFRHWLLNSTYIVSNKTLTRTRTIWNISSSIGYYCKSNHNSLLYNLFLKKNENGRNLLFKCRCAYMYECITLYYLILIRMGPEHFQQYDQKDLRWPRSVIFFSNKFKLFITWLDKLSSKIYWL